MTDNEAAAVSPKLVGPRNVVGPYTVGMIDESCGVWPLAIERIKQMAKDSGDDL
jgi:hypothetical protein